MEASTRVRAGIAAAALAILSGALVAGAAGPADAAKGHKSGKHYQNCTALAKDFKHGVAKNKRAAKRQVRAGYGRPASGKRAQKVYWANYKSMDRDRDGSACER